METKKRLPLFAHIITDVEVEKNVLGSILSYGRTLSEISQLICRECFSTPFHQDVYEAAISLNDKGEPVDMLTVHTQMQRMGTSTELTAYQLSTLMEASSPWYYNNALVLTELCSRNKAWALGQRLSMKARDMTYDLTDSVDETNIGLADIFDTPASGITDMNEAAQVLYKDHIEKNLSGENTLTGAPTGFREFDSLSGGLQPGNLLVVAGETSQGKTSFATAIITSAARAGYPVAFYSMEMTATELFARIIACRTGVPANTYLYRQLNAVDLGLYDNAYPDLAALPVYFDDKSTSNIDVILSSIRVMVARKGIRGAVVDYLQILNVNMKGINKEQQMGEVCRRLKNLAKELGIWIIALSQLRRDDNNHIPGLHRLRDSGQIAEAADTVILLYRPEVYGLRYPKPFQKVSTNGTAMVDIAKGRNIGLAKFIVGFEPSVTRFYELDRLPEAAEDDNNDENDNPF